MLKGEQSFLNNLTWRAEGMKMLKMIRGPTTAGMNIFLMTGLDIDIDIGAAGTFDTS